MTREFSSKITAYIPVVLPNWSEKDNLIKIFEKGLNELIALGDNLKIEFPNDFESCLNITVTKDIEKLTLYKDIWEGPPSPYWDFWFLGISTIFEYSKDDVERAFGHVDILSFSQKKECYASAAALEIKQISSNLLLAINLSKCGLIQTGKGTVFYDDAMLNLEINGTYNFFYETKIRANENGWPQVLELELEKVWKWLNSFDFFHESMGEDRIGRAIAAITYLLKDNFSEAAKAINLDMIWMLVGLEALYGRGRNDLQRQLIEKSKVFLGNSMNINKQMSRAYDLRSRIIHGDIDIPFSYCIEEEEDKYKHLLSKLDDAYHTVLSLLIATIQKLIIEEKVNLEFEYKVLEKK